MDPRVTEFHCIMPMANIGSVIAHGILSYERAAMLPHHSVAMQPVQDRRDRKLIPGGLRLHQYANLYIHARNPMLFKRLSEASSLCVLRVSTDVLRVDGVVLSDQNAASDYVRFVPPADWRFLPFDDILAMDWRHPGDQIAFWRHKARKCAEVLVPHHVEPRYLTGAYVVDATTQTRLADLGFTMPISVDSVLFFRQQA